MFNETKLLQMKLYY